MIFLAGLFTELFFCFTLLLVYCVTKKEDYNKVQVPRIIQINIIRESQLRWTLVWRCGHPRRNTLVIILVA